MSITIRKRRDTPSSWAVEDDEGRQNLGTITEVGGFGIAVHGPHSTPLDGISIGPYASLDEVAEAIAAHLNTSCSLADENGP
jgi:hypothetical protein